MYEGTGDSIVQNLLDGKPDTVRVYRDTTYVDYDGNVRHHYDVCTGFKMYSDGSLDCDLGNVPKWKWEPHIFGDSYKYFD